MIRGIMKKRIAENLGLLSSDNEIIVEGRVTIEGIENKIDDVYREELFPILSDKYPQDFEITTYPYPTYTITGVADSRSTGTTLTATTAVFNNAIEGFTIFNATDNISAKIVTYISNSQVTLDTTINDTWDGDTFYVLGNEFYIGGQMADMKELTYIGIKFSASDPNFTPCTLIDRSSEIRTGTETFIKSSPRYYFTSMTINSAPVPAIGFLPFPDSYQGKIQFRYIQKPPSLSTDSMEPVFKNAGITEAIINRATAWGYRLLKQYDAAAYWDGLYKESLSIFIASYKPKSRTGPTYIRPVGYINALKFHRI